MTNKPAQSVGFEYDLGGEPKDSAERSTGPCAIRALAIFLGRPWAEVAALEGLSEGGSLMRRAVADGRSIKGPLWEAMDKLGLAPQLGFLHQVSLDSALRSSGLDTCIVVAGDPECAPDHLAAVVDGELRDSHDWREELVVSEVWGWKRPDQLPKTIRVKSWPAN